jgi:AraC-like DNA-binding protein
MQDRLLLAAAAGLQVERVHAHGGPAVWSPAYRAPSRRKVLPGAGAVSLRVGGQQWLADALTAFQLDQSETYQLHPEAEGARTHLVLSESPCSQPPPAPARAWLLAPDALYRLRVLWREVAAARATPADAARQVGATLSRASVLQAADPAPVGRARRFLLGGDGAAASVGDIADAACSSPAHLSRVFRRHLGITLHEYRQRLRLGAALDALQAGERDLAGLAHALGFSSHSHFGSVFRRAIGVSPAQARAALAG